MNAPDLIRRLHEHRWWVNEQLLAVCARLDEAALRQPYSIGQGSIWKSLLHMYAAEFVWLEALQGNEEPLLPGDVRGQLPGNQLGQGGIESFAELADGWNALNRRWQGFLANLAPEALEEPVYKTSSSSQQGQRIGTRRSDVLLHVATHAQYTTAQVMNMLRQAGVEKLPDPMLITLARRQATFMD